jgi:predicted porin
VIENGVNIDTGTGLGQSGAANASTATFASRDSYLGLGGNWGDVRMGRQSVYWVSGPLTPTGPNYVDMTADFITGPGMLVIPSARNNNVLSYNSPTWSGFNFTVSYSPNATEGAGYTGTGQTKDDLWGVTLRYNHPQFYVQGDWARRRNTNATFCAAAACTPTGVPKIVGMKAGIGWKYAPGSMISFLAERLRNDNVAAAGAIVTAGDDLRQNIYLINWEHTFGQWAVYALYAWSSSVKGITTAGLTGGTKSRGYTLAAKYHFSKRTGVYVSWSQIRNDTNQWADSAGGGMSSAGAAGIGVANAGADPRNIGVGMMHNF